MRAAAEVAGNRERGQEMQQAQQLRLRSLARATHAREVTGLSLVSIQNGFTALKPSRALDVILFKPYDSLTGPFSSLFHRSEEGNSESKHSVSVTPEIDGARIGTRSLLLPR